LERGKEEEKENLETEKKGKKSLAASHPSVKGQRPQERWIGVYTGNHRRHPLPNPIFRLRSALPVTGVLAVGRGRRESILYAGAEPATRLLGRIPVCKRMSHLNFPPKLCSNSIFKPQPAGTGGARKRTSFIFGSKFTNSFSPVSSRR